MNKAILFLAFLFMTPNRALLAMDTSKSSSSDDDVELLIAEKIKLSPEEQDFVDALAKIYVDFHVRRSISGFVNLIEAFREIGLAEPLPLPENEQQPDPIGTAATLLQQIQEMQTSNGFKDYKLNEKAMGKTSDEAFLEAWNETQNAFSMINPYKSNSLRSTGMAMMDTSFCFGSVASGPAFVAGASPCLFGSGIACLSLSAFYAVARIAFACHGIEEYRKREEWLENKNLRPHIIKAGLEYADTLDLDSVFSLSREEINDALKKLR